MAKKDHTIQEWFGLSQVQGAFGAGNYYPARTDAIADPTLLYGVEFEIEGLTRKAQSYCVSGMIAKTDDSLRNNGAEFITMPMRYNDLATITEQFFETAKWNENNYSERCSIHVHANCQDLTFKQLGGVLMLYQGFEKLLYNFVGGDRDKNIFCVPWSETTITYNVVNKLQKDSTSAVRNWQKYTGLNIRPLSEIGTIEFRQMPGIFDVQKILHWYNIIGCLFDFVRKNDLDKIKSTLVDLNTTSEYARVMDDVFGPWSALLKTGDYRAALEDGILNLKFMIIESTRKEKQPEPVPDDIGEGPFSIPDTPVPTPRSRAVPRPSTADIMNQLSQLDARERQAAMRINPDIMAFERQANAAQAAVPQTTANPRMFFDSTGWVVNQVGDTVTVPTTNPTERGTR